MSNLARAPFHLLLTNVTGSNCHQRNGGQDSAVIIPVAILDEMLIKQPATSTLLSLARSSKRQSRRGVQCPEKKARGNRYKPQLLRRA